MQRDAGTLFGAQATDTFLGLPSASLADLDRPIAIVGAPAATPYPSVGAYCAEAPRAIRTASAAYAANVAHIDFDLGGPIFPGGEVAAVDLGDLAFDEADSATNRDRIRDTVRAIIDRDAVPVVIGGDDSVPIPVFQAFAGRGPVTLLQIDAHIDWRDEVMGERLGLSSTMRRASEMAHVERIVQVGQRAIGSARPGDLADAKAWGAILVPASEVHEHGIEPVLAAVPTGAQVILTFDCDGLDPAIMPAVIGPAPGGLSYWQALKLLHGIAAKARIAAFDLVEFVPERDMAGLGALTAARIIVNVLGLLARQAAPASD
jgi:agmatinase